MDINLEEPNDYILIPLEDYEADEYLQTNYPYPGYLTAAKARYIFTYLTKTAEEDKTAKRVQKHNEWFKKVYPIYWNELENARHFYATNPTKHLSDLKREQNT